MKKALPNDKQLEIIEAVIDIFERLKLNVNIHTQEINDAFNPLTAKDWEWTKIEDGILKSINSLKSISPHIQPDNPPYYHFNMPIIEQFFTGLLFYLVGLATGYYLYLVKYREEKRFILTTKGRICRIERENRDIGMLEVSFGIFLNGEWSISSRVKITNHAVLKRLTSTEAVQELERVRY